MHHPYFEEWKAREETRRLDAIARQAWKRTPQAGRERGRGREWRIALRIAALRVCVSLRWNGQPER